MKPLTRALVRKIFTVAMLGIVATCLSYVPTASAAGTLFVQIGTGGVSVRVGETRNYYAVLVQDNGTIVNPVTASWSVTGPATVDSAGNVTGTATAANAQVVVTATFSDPVLTGGATVTGTRNHTIQASQDVWTGGGGPAQGGDVRSLITVGSSMLAGVYGGGVYRTTGGGWEPSYYGLSFSSSARVTALRTVPNTANGLVAAVDGAGIYRSSDGGSSWVPSNTGMGCNFPNGFTARTSNSSLYVRTSCGVYKSTNGGVSWSSVNAGLPAGRVTTLQAFGSSETVWAAVDGAGLYRSTNGGTSWTARNNGLPAGPYGLQVYSFDAVSSGLYLAMVESVGIYRSSDSGATWVPQNSGLPASYGFQGSAGGGALNDGYLYVAIDGYGIYRGTTGSNSSDPVIWSAWGNTATQLPLSSSQVVGFNGVYYVRTGRGVYTSSDNGMNWTAFRTGLPGGYVINSVTDPSNTNLVYAAGNTVYKSTDAGVNWNASGAGITGAVSRGRRGGPGNITRGGDGALYVTTVNAGIFKSTDGAASWTPVNNGLPALIAQGMSVRNDAGDPQTIYALFGTDPYGVWKTVNGGTSWSSISGDLAGNALKTEEIAKDPATGNLYLATAGGVYKSVNGGANWTPIYTATSARHVRLDTGTTPSTVYWATFVNDSFNQPLTSSGVYKSADQGATYTQILSGRLVNNLRVVRPGGVLQMYVASWNLSTLVNQSRVLRSLDGGATWPSISAGMLSQVVGSFDTVNQQLVRASTRGAGVFNFVPDPAPAPTQETTSPTSGAVVAGWNLMGNGGTAAINASAFSDTNKITTVWKWIANTAKWAFYAPSLIGQALTDYANSKGYDVLTTIAGGEGFWVNAKIDFSTQFSAPGVVNSSSFQTQLDGSSSLLTGWNLIAIGDNKTPSAFNRALSATPPAAGDIPLNITTLWAWDAALTNWYFYASSLEKNGGLLNYIQSKNYLDFGTKTLMPTTGFWVNKP